LARNKVFRSQDLLVSSSVCGVVFVAEMNKTSCSSAVRYQVLRSVPIHNQISKNIHFRHLVVLLRLGKK
jgi:hypothetical protein